MKQVVRFLPIAIAAVSSLAQAGAQAGSARFSECEKALVKAEETQVWRILEDSAPDAETLAWMERIYGTRILFTDPRRARLIRLPGIAIHQTLSAKSFARAELNPLLISESQMRLLQDNKIAEYFSAPEIFPRSEVLSELLGAEGIQLDVLSERDALSAIQSTLKNAFPNGYYLKPSDGFASLGKFPSDKTDLHAELSRWRKKLKKKYKAFLANGGDPVSANLEFRHEAGYMGLFIERILAERGPKGKLGELFLVQEKLSPSEVLVEFDGEAEPYAEEARVIFLHGELLNGATKFRYDKPPSREAMRRLKLLEQEAVKRVARLPAEVRRLPMALDIMRVIPTEAQTRRARESGLDPRFAVIELNVGFEAGHFYPEYDLYTAQLFAEHFSGAPPAILQQMRKVLLARKLETKVAHLDVLMADADIQRLVREEGEEVLDTFLWKAVGSMVDLLRRDPSRQRAREILEYLEEKELDDFLLVEDEALIDSLI